MKISSEAGEGTTIKVLEFTILSINSICLGFDRRPELVLVFLGIVS